MTDFAQGLLLGLIIGFFCGGAIVFVLLMTEAWRRYTEKQQHQP